MAVNADDATLPLDNALSSPAAEGAAEFRALKAKVNALFLNTGIGVDYTKLITTNNEGINAVISDASNADLYGSKFKVTRTASALTRQTNGIYSEAILSNGLTVSSGAVNGISSVCNIGTTCTFSFAIGLSSVIYNQTHFTSATLIGLFTSFANRLLVGNAAPSGLGNNMYNRGSNGIYIDAFPRSSAGEYCGWKTGIKFTATSIDRDFDGPGYAIDIGALTFVGGTDPFNAYRCKAAIKLNNFLGIIWDNTDAIITYFDSVTGRFTFGNTGTKRFEIDMVTGAIYRNGVIVP